MRIAIVLVFLAGCLKSSSVVCGDVVCPQGTICADVTDPDQTICATADQLAACDAKNDHLKCQSPAIPSGRCYQGVCLAAICGNGRVDAPDPADPTDVGEACDDGNQVSGDGCSGDCTSDETCGNGIVDYAAHELCDDRNRVDNDGCDDACQLETVVWEQSGFVPLDRQEFGMAWDAARHQVVMFGGVQVSSTAANGTLLRDTWLWDGRGWTEVNGAVAPTARRNFSMVYDSDRKRVVLFGGTPAVNSGLNDTWEWDGETWIPMLTTVSPPPRFDYGMAYDAVNHHTVVYGGRNPILAQNHDYADTWTWDGTTWKQLVTAHTPLGAATAPAGDGRSETAMAFDPSRGVTVLFGGNSWRTAGVGAVSPVVCDAHVWELDGTDWHDINPAAGPTARSDSAFAFDPVAHKLLLVGGEVGINPVADEWTWNGTAWASVSTSPAPPARQDQAMTTDVDRGVIVLFGGSQVDNTPTWEWNRTHWTDVTAQSPFLLTTAATTFDSGRGRGVFVEPNLGATYERLDSGWAQQNESGPTSAYTLAMVYDPAHANSVVLVGEATTSQTWLWNGTAWVTAMPATEPSGRTNHALALDSTGQVMLFGGFDNTTNAVLADTWTWNGTTWKKHTPTHSPPARQSHALGYDPVRGKTILFGGDDGSGTIFDDTWAWDGTDWTQLTTPVAPSPRENVPLVWEPNRERLVMVSGNPNGIADVWEWDGALWLELAIPPQPPGRSKHVIVPDRDGGGLEMFGGYQSTSTIQLSDVWRLRWQGVRTSDSCDPAFDLNGNQLVGCQDPDCWYVCTPLCPPGVTGATCNSICGNGNCDPTESCRSCSADCGACMPVCGDGFCDPGETGCKADCP